MKRERETSKFQHSIEIIKKKPGDSSFYLQQKMYTRYQGYARFSIVGEQ